MSVDVELERNRSSEFLKQGDPWSLYMLNPPTINQGHYTIFETIQFSNLYALTGDEFFRKERDLRRHVLQERYPIYEVGTGKGSRIFFSLMGAPHPYELDIYGIRIDCKLSNGEIRTFTQYKQFDKRVPLSERLFIDEALDFSENPVCTVFSNSSGTFFPLYETSEFKEVGTLTEPENISYGLTASLDAYLKSGDVVVDPSRKYNESVSYLNTQGRIEYKINPVRLTDDSLLGIELTPDVDLAVGVQLQNGPKSIFRYYPKLKAGMKNIILLSKLGFDHGNKIDSVSDIIVFVYTDLQKDIATVKVGKILLFPNQTALAPYFLNNPVNVGIQ